MPITFIHSLLARVQSHGHSLPQELSRKCFSSWVLCTYLKVRSLWYWVIAISLSSVPYNTISENDYFKLLVRSCHSSIQNFVIVPISPKVKPKLIRSPSIWYQDVVFELIKFWKWVWGEKVCVYIFILGYYKVFFYKGHLKQFTNNNIICSVLFEEFYALITSNQIAVSFKVCQVIILLLTAVSQSHE